MRSCAAIFPNKSSFVGTPLTEKKEQRNCIQRKRAFISTTKGTENDRLRVLPSMHAIAFALGAAFHDLDLFGRQAVEGIHQLVHLPLQRAHVRRRACLCVARRQVPRVHREDAVKQDEPSAA